jgi:rhodanese-related sulfurtransferase
MKTTVLIVTLLVSTTAIFAQQFKETDAVTALKLVKEGAVFIDVREKDEAATTAYGIDGVRNIPLNELETRMNEVPTTGTVILACNSGYRSGEAAKLLMANGRKDVYSLKGGILQWQRDGQPVVRKE